MEARAVLDRLALLERALVDIENAEFLTPADEPVSKERLGGIIEEIKREKILLNKNAEPKVLSQTRQET